MRAATAAPTYFEPAQLKTMNGKAYHALIDGAVIAYNPALFAYVEARRLYPKAQDFILVSLGTGQLTRGLSFKEVKDWGAARWAQPLFSLMCDGDAVVVDHQISEVLPPGPDGERRYYRFQARLNIGSDDMDDASSEKHRQDQAARREPGRAGAGDPGGPGAPLAGQLNRRVSHRANATSPSSQPANMKKAPTRYRGLTST